MHLYQERVVTEKRELDDKIEKLATFIKTGAFVGLDADEQERLQHQDAIMQEYSVILGERIAHF
jgi:hypothetical protein